MREIENPIIVDALWYWNEKEIQNIENEGEEDENTI